MMVSTKGRYALRVMIDLAEHHDGSFIPLKDIAQRQEISKKYLESIVVVLSKGGLITGLHGKGGGYQLNRSPDAYSIGGILKLIEGSLAPVACLECKPMACARAGQCRTLPMWQKLDEMIDTFFEGITLADLVREEPADHYEI